MHPGVCSQCNKDKKIVAKGLCRLCYSRQDSQKQKRAEFNRTHKEELRAARRLKYLATDEHQRVMSQAFRDAHPGWERNYRLKREYGITASEYEELVASQENKCAVCRRAGGTGAKDKLYVDHNHETGRVRALLCLNCNFLVGHAHESPEILRAAADYISAYGAP